MRSERVPTSDSRVYTLPRILSCLLFVKSPQYLVVLRKDWIKILISVRMNMHQFSSFTVIFSVSDARMTRRKKNSGPRLTYVSLKLTRTLLLWRKLSKSVR